MEKNSANYGKLSGSYSLSVIGQMKAAGYENVPLGVIITMKDIAPNNAVDELKQRGLTVSTTAKNFVLGQLKVKDIQKILELNFVKSLEVSKKAKLHSDKSRLI